MSAPPTEPAEVAPGPAAAVMSLPILVLPSSIFSNAAGAITRSTKSVAVPPICKPTLAPPMLYIAGADHRPTKFLLPRQVIGPRPPVPPTIKAPFFTLGSTITQSAFASRLAGMLLSFSMPFRTVAAFPSVSSSFEESSACTGHTKEPSSRAASKQAMPILLRDTGFQTPLIQPDCVASTLHPSPPGIKLAVLPILQIVGKVCISLQVRQFRIESFEQRTYPKRENARLLYNPASITLAIGMAIRARRERVVMR